MNNTTIIELIVTINNNNNEINKLRREKAEYIFCKDIIKRINDVCNNFKEAIINIDKLTTVGSSDRTLMIESLLEAYTYELESLKEECKKHNVKKENMDLIFLGLGF